MSNLSDALVIPNFEQCGAERLGLAAETMAAQLQDSLCNFVFIGYFQYIY